MSTQNPARFSMGFVLLLLLLTQSVHAQVSGISYTVTPGIEHIAFDKEAGMDDTQLYGGRLGFSFGEYVELSGIYLFNDNARTRLDRLSVFPDVAPEDLTFLERDVAMKRYGGQLKINLGSALIHPYILGGTGIIRFEPDNLEKSESIYVSGGVGLQYSLERRYTILLQAEALSYRHNPGTLLSEADFNDLGISPGDLTTERKTNIGLRAGVQIYLGGRKPGEMTEVDRAFREQFSGGLSGLRLKVEPFWGQVDFDSDLGFRKNQRMAGVFAGFDFGSYVGVRGFYWRGVQDNEIAQFEDLQAYGGEMTLNFTTPGSSLTPYLTIGGGFMDVFGDYQGNATVVPEDQTFALVGAGVSLPLGETVRVQGNVRSLLMSSLDAEEISNPNQVQSSFMYSAGISFGLGRKARTGGRLLEEELSADRRRTMTEQERLAAELAAREQAISRAESRIDSLAALLVAAQEGNQAAMERLRTQLRRDSLQVAATTKAGQAKPEQEAPATKETMAAGAPAAQKESSWVSLPVPQEGELYVRYGRPGGVSVESLTGDAVVVDPVTGAILSGLAPAQGAAPGGNAESGSQTAGLTPEQLQAIVQQAVRAELSQLTSAGEPGATPLLEATMIERLTQRLEERIAEMERRLEQRLQEMSARPAPTPSEPAPVVITQEPTTTGNGLQALYPLTGVNLSNPQQVLIGIRAELRNSATGPMRLMPELILGYGEDNSRALNLNVATPTKWTFFDTYQPYVGAGIGFVSGDRLEAVLNVLAGVERSFGFGSLFGEFMTLDFFDQNRLLFGYRVRF